jgi:hypothetical protein
MYETTRRSIPEDCLLLSQTVVEPRTVPCNSELTGRERKKLNEVN